MQNLQASIAHTLEHTAHAAAATALALAYLALAQAQLRQFQGLLPQRVLGEQGSDKGIVFALDFAEEMLVQHLGAFVLVSRDQLAQFGLNFGRADCV